MDQKKELKFGSFEHQEFPFMRPKDSVFVCKGITGMNSVSLVALENISGVGLHFPSNNILNAEK